MNDKIRIGMVKRGIFTQITFFLKSDDRISNAFLKTPFRFVKLSVNAVHTVSIHAECQWVKNYRV